MPMLLGPRVNSTRERWAKVDGQQGCPYCQRNDKAQDDPSCCASMAIRQRIGWVSARLIGRHHVPLAGSYSSAEARAAPPLLL
jgi:hypothetical protein